MIRCIDYSIDALMNYSRNSEVGSMRIGAGLYMYMYDVVVEKFTFDISSPDEFLYSFNLNVAFHCLAQC